MITTTSRTPSGWGRVAPSRALVTGPLDIGQLADLVKAAPADRLDHRAAASGGRLYLAKDARLSREAFARMYGDLEKWRAVKAELDPRATFRSDLGLRLGLVAP